MLFFPFMLHPPIKSCLSLLLSTIFLFLSFFQDLTQLRAGHIALQPAVLRYTDTCPVSSETMIVTESVTSLMPTPARCLVPSCLLSSILSESGR